MRTRPPSGCSSKCPASIPRGTAKSSAKFWIPCAGRAPSSSRRDSRYRLDLEDDSKEHLEQLLSRTVDELKDRGSFVFENLISLLEQSDFNPFTLAHGTGGSSRKVRWHFHDWDLQVYLGEGIPKEPAEGLALQIGLPWGAPAAGTHCYKILPETDRA